MNQLTQKYVLKVMLVIPILYTKLQCENTVILNSSQQLLIFVLNNICKMKLPKSIVRTNNSIVVPKKKGYGNRTND